ncbi:hypothetical protein [Larkinella arboricola]
MVNVKLAKAIQLPGVQFRIGGKSITLTQTATLIDEAAYNAIRLQYPGWIQRVSGKATLKTQEA